MMQNHEYNLEIVLDNFKRYVDREYINNTIKLFCIVSYVGSIRDFQ